MLLVEHRRAEDVPWVACPYLALEEGQVPTATSVQEKMARFLDPQAARGAAWAVGPFLASAEEEAQMKKSQALQLQLVLDVTLMHALQRSRNALDPWAEVVEGD